MGCSMAHVTAVSSTARFTFQLNVNRNVFLQSMCPITCTTHPYKAGKRTVSSDNLVYQTKAIFGLHGFQRASSEGELQ